MMVMIFESMAAGLAPIVPNVGGQTEFVPQNFTLNLWTKLQI